MSRRLRALRDHQIHGEAGISLVEMMIALLIMAIGLSALASTLIKTIQTTTRNEQDVTATAVAQQAVEQLQSAEWELTGLYEDELTVGAMGAADFVRWTARVDTSADAGDPSTWTLDGEPLNILDGPGAIPRDNAPLPTELQTTNGIDFRVDRYVTQIDRDQDGTVDTRHFVTFVSWTDRFGNVLDIRFESERSPSREEAQAGDDIMRVMYFYVAPTTMDLDDDAEPLHDVTVLVKTNRPIATGTGTLTWESLDGTPTPELLYSDAKKKTNTLAMTGSDLTTLDGFTGFTTWKATISKSAGLKYYDGQSTFSFTGEDANPDITLPDATASRSVEYRNGGILVSPPSPNPTPDVPAAAPITLDSVVKGANVLCTNPTFRTVETAFNLTIKVNGLDGSVTPPDGKVFVTYTRRATKFSTQTTAERVSATYVGIVGGNPLKTEWRLTIPVDAGFWLAGDVLNFVLQAERPSDSGSALFLDNNTTVTVSSSC